MKRWTVAVRGVESGQLHELLFARFWTEKGAQQFVERMERRNPDALTEWLVAKVSDLQPRGSYQP